MLQLRPATPADSDQLWHIFRAVVQSGDTFTFSADITQKEAMDFGLAEGHQCIVAEQNNKILGSYIIKANHPGGGAHIANGSYMVGAAAGGQGRGYRMGVHSLEQARVMGFRAAQFNIAASSNTPALRLWDKLGFSIIGTIPDGFKHKDLGYIDAHILFKSLV